MKITHYAPTAGMHWIECHHCGHRFPFAFNMRGVANATGHTMLECPKCFTLDPVKPLTADWNNRCKESK